MSSPLGGRTGDSDTLNSKRRTLQGGAHAGAKGRDGHRANTTHGPRSISPYAEDAAHAALGATRNRWIREMRVLAAPSPAPRARVPGQRYASLA